MVKTNDFPFSLFSFIIACTTNTAYIDLAVESEIRVEYQFKSTDYAYFAELKPPTNSLFQVGLTSLEVTFGVNPTDTFTCTHYVRVIGKYYSVSTHKTIDPETL